mgnify:CR=1 FL=1
MNYGTKESGEKNNFWIIENKNENVKSKIKNYIK